MTVNGDETTMKFQDLNNISYKNNYKIKFWFAEPTRGLYYANNRWNQVKTLGTNNITFEIINNNLIKL